MELDNEGRKPENSTGKKGTAVATLHPCTVQRAHGGMFASIARRAYDFLESRGREHGKDLEDWFHAEGERFETIQIDLLESGDILTASAEAPNLRSTDIALSIKPRRLIIAAEKEVREGDRGAKQPRRWGKYALGALDLPVDVDPFQALAALDDGGSVIAMKEVAPKNIPDKSREVAHELCKCYGLS